MIDNLVSTEPGMMANSKWKCPLCDTMPSGNTFKVLVMDTTSGVSLIRWVNGDRTPDGRIVFRGCSECLDKTLAKDPLAAALFKLIWREIAKTVPKMRGIPLMPNIGSGRTLHIEV